MFAEAVLDVAVEADAVDDVLLVEDEAEDCWFSIACSRSPAVSVPELEDASSEKSASASLVVPPFDVTKFSNSDLVTLPLLPPIAETRPSAICPADICGGGPGGGPIGPVEPDDCASCSSCERESPDDAVPPSCAKSASAWLCVPPRFWM